jgi:hypothetical protein
MAFSATKVGETVVGSLRMTYGYWTAGGDTGGNINTGLHQCVSINLTAAGTSIVADAPTVNESDLLSGKGIDGSAVTIITTSNTSGLWQAFGW